MTDNSDTIGKLADAYARAWSSGSPPAVAAHFATGGRIVINRSAPLVGPAAIAEMAAGFFAAFPGMVVTCDDVRSAGNHVLFAWTLEGRHAETKNSVRVSGWEEWELDADGKIASSLGWFDAEEYERQIRDGVGETGDRIRNRSGG
jgi:uncharacterized protein (TIGR02246 family)